jgi:hypothetical protein
MAITIAHDLLTSSGSQNLNNNMAQIISKIKPTLFIISLHSIILLFTPTYNPVQNAHNERFVRR